MKVKTEHKKELQALSRIDALLKDLASRDVRVSDLLEVRGYLYRYPEMADLLDHAIDSVHSHFASPLQLNLEVYRDPESNDRYLLLSLRLPEYDDTVMERIRIIRKEYSSFLAGATGWFLLTTDFSPPE